jgi:hypothetical protein
MSLNLYLDPISARRETHRPNKGEVLQLHVNQSTRYFWPYLPLLDTDGINLPTLQKKELFYQVTPDLPNGLSLDSTTGIVCVDGQKIMTQELTAYTFTVLYEFNVMTNVIGIKIDPCPPLESCLELTVNQPDFIYSLPYETTSVPVLPVGITLLATSDKLAISGTKLQAQASTEYSFETKTGIKYSLCISVKQVPYFENPLYIKKHLTVGNSVHIDLPIIKGGVKPFIYEATPSLPSGLYIDSCSGSVLGTGTVLVPDVMSYKITARDHNCVYTSNAVCLDLIIKPCLCSTSECEACLTFTVNQKDTTFQPIIADCGHKPYTYSVCPELPHGFHLSSETGLVTVRGCDVKPMGITEFIFKVSDNEGNTFSKTVCLIVNPTHCIECCCSDEIVLTENQKDTVLTVFKTVYGTKPYLYSVHPALPPGIDLDRLTGELRVTGSELVAEENTPTKVYSFTVIDKCLVDVVAHEILKIRIVTAPEAYCDFSCPPEFKHTTRLLKGKSECTDIALTVNKPTEFTILNASKGAPPLTYYISCGCLPDFLTLNPNSGVLSGTPPVQPLDSKRSHQPFNFTIAVKDKNDVSARYECSVSIVVRCQACFPGKALAKLENGNTVTLSELKIGDKIYTGVDRLSEVYLFTHALSTAETPFIELTTENEHTIVLSAGHYLYVNGVLAKAETVSLNDVLQTKTGESCVTSIEHVRETGLYNPHTLDGDIMINGVCTSTYTDALRPDLAHGILAPVRYLYALR